jgi:Tfp pilus assembly protein PilV
MHLGNNDGLTLPEAMIACLIFGLTLSAILTGFVMCQKTAVYANNNLIAMHDARRLMEDLVTHKYSDSDLSVGTHNLTNAFYVVTEASGVKDVALTVWWIDPTRSASSSVTLVSSVANAVHQ